VTFQDLADKTGIALDRLLPITTTTYEFLGHSRVPGGWHNIEAGLGVLETTFRGDQGRSRPEPSVLQRHLSLNLGLEKSVPANTGNADETKPRHSLDFTSVNWFGTEYTFTPSQGRVVEFLWKAWENRTPDVRYDSTIKDAADVDSASLPMLFDKGKHPALEKMIVSKKKGSYRLQVPCQPEESKELVPAPDTVERLVTLNQMAALVNKTKRTLEKYKDKLPLPRVHGREGRASEWAWSEVRPVLERLFGRPLPEHFPQFVGGNG
jgi:hypothetical protein